MSIAPVRPKIRGGVGESIERPDGAPKVKGEFLYGSDLRREGMLFGATLRSPHPHARIVSIDIAAAKKMSGVRAILTSGDLPTRELFGLMRLDQPVLASGSLDGLPGRFADAPSRQSALHLRVPARRL